MSAHLAEFRFAQASETACVPSAAPISSSPTHSVAVSDLFERCLADVYPRHLPLSIPVKRDSSNAPMPSLGFLKKKRTKDSQGSASDFQGTSSASKTPTSPTSPTVDGGAIDRVLSKNSAYSQEPDSIAGDVDTVGPTSNPAPTSAGNMNNNQPSIQSMLNQPSQNDSGYSSTGGSTQQENAQNSKINANPKRETKGKYTLTDFNFQRTLGTGSFGRVHLVQSKHNTRYYAVKVLKKQQVVKMKQVEHTNDERSMLQRCRHPFLITLWGTWQDSKNLYMVMDFIEGGELFSLLRKSQVRQLFCNHFYKSGMANPWLSALPESSSQILRRRSDPGARLLAQHEHHLPRSEA